ncbi:MAG: TIGR04086 family membrane protein [Provencibacterium sp.]|jgi:putative membrane protein (TIGR04086 family)|nr:TIGR04086 family membrane protein [Provencibacterium sp.]
MSNSRYGLEEGLKKLFLKPVLWGLAVSAAVCALLLLLLSGILTLRDVPLRFIDPIMIVAVSLSCFAGGCLSARLAREKGLWVGLTCSGAFFLLLLLCGLPLTAGQFTTLLPVKLFSMLLCGAAGGVLGVNLRTRRK